MIFWIDLVLLAALFLLSAFFSSSETAFFSMDPVHMRKLEERASRGAKQHGIAAAIELMKEPNDLLSTVLIGNLVVNVAITVVSTRIALEALPGNGLLVAVPVVTVSLLIFCEVGPKTYAVNHCDRLSVRAAPILKIFHRVISPARRAFTRAAEWTLSPFIPLGSGEKTGFISREELRSFIEDSEKAGVIDAEEKKIMQRVFTFSSRKVSEIMTPLSEMVYVTEGMGLKEILEAGEEGGVSRLPVLGGSGHGREVIGFVHLRDLLRFRYEDVEFDLSKVTMDIVKVDPDMKAADCFELLRRKKRHMALVQGGHTRVGGGHLDIQGIVTLEDLLEVVVGELEDESDMKPVIPVKETNGTAYMISGRMSINQFNKLFDCDIEARRLETMGGYLATSLGREPSEGMSAWFGDNLLTIMEIRRGKIRRIKIERKTDGRPGGKGMEQENLPPYTSSELSAGTQGGMPPG